LACQLFFLHFQESVAGAKQFISGVGRHGKFYNITDKKQTEPIRSKIWTIISSQCLCQVFVTLLDIKRLVAERYKAEA